ncbi:hypothetical protein NDU88_005185 [Pleurodeles waltl]|uniref:Uncharacterized protein n=1 Tax=Pleurodeles waltl TaxID=8319 RepID=A0AAV7WBA0_PLEWA|nr:hypothetical protein NDU88_005185 [Pleurodeles waltl]
MPQGLPCGEAPSCSILGFVCSQSLHCSPSATAPPPTSPGRQPDSTELHSSADPGLPCATPATPCGYSCLVLPRGVSSAPAQFVCPALTLLSGELVTANGAVWEGRQLRGRLAPGACGACSFRSTDNGRLKGVKELQAPEAASRA